MAEPRVSPVITSGSPVPVDATCLRCKREGVFHVVLYVMDTDGPRRVGEKLFCVCETRLAEKPLITNGDAKRTGDACERCNRVSMYEVPFYAMTSAGIAPHSTRVICRDCDTRPKR
jgi:hypothetical protein